LQVAAKEEMKDTDKKDTDKKDTDRKDTDKKDTDKKKQTTSPFQMWAKEHRAQVKEEMGGKLTAQELVKEMALRWKALNKQSKLSFKRKAPVDGEGSSSSSPPEDKENTRRGSSKKSRLDKKASPKSKGACGAFHFFLSEARAWIRMESVDKMSAKQIHELALHEWEALPAEDMQKYVEMAVEDAQRIRRKKPSSETPEVEAGAE